MKSTKKSKMANKKSDIGDNAKIFREIHALALGTLKGIKFFLERTALTS